MNDNLVDTNPYDFIEKEPAVKKPPRKPRPSEIAAKKAREAAKKAKAKPKAKPKAAKKSRAKKAKKVVKRKTATAVLRSERLDLRLTKAEKQKLVARAKATRRTITSIALELIEKMK